MLYEPNVICNYKLTARIYIHRVFNMLLSNRLSKFDIDSFFYVIGIDLYQYSTTWFECLLFGGYRRSPTDYYLFCGAIGGIGDFQEHFNTITCRETVL